MVPPSVVMVARIVAAGTDNRGRNKGKPHRRGEPVGLY
jgi:hypothetical protein